MVMVLVLQRARDPHPGGICLAIHVLGSCDDITRLQCIDVDRSSYLQIWLEDR